MSTWVLSKLFFISPNFFTKKFFRISHFQKKKIQKLKKILKKSSCFYTLHCSSKVARIYKRILTNFYFHSWSLIKCGSIWLYMITTMATSQNWNLKKKKNTSAKQCFLGRGGGKGARSNFAFSWPEQNGLEFSTNTKDFCGKKALIRQISRTGSRGSQNIVFVFKEFLFVAKVMITHWEM